MSAPLVIRRALLSVSDKSGLSDFAAALSAAGVELISTGGTARHLRAEGLKVADVSAVTGAAEILDGRVKTLHPAIHGGILARRDRADDMSSIPGPPIDLVVVNLYPFESAASGGADFDACIEQIDIGGPAMIRAAAKNNAHVCVVTDTADYGAITEALAAGGASLGLRRRLAAKAFRHTAYYDAVIADWFSASDDEAYPERLTAPMRRAATLHYGENPQQTAALYAQPGPARGLAGARQIQGKPLSYNNLHDADAAYGLALELGDAQPAVVIVKHANPCGVARADASETAYDAAFQCDPVSAFGGVVAVTRPITAPLAERISKVFTEVVVAPGIEDAAAALLGKQKKLRLLIVERQELPASRQIKPISGGYLVQTPDTTALNAAALEIVTKRAPSAEEIRDLLFAEQVAKFVKSNAIVYAKNGATVGVGAGQMSRVDAARIAALKAEDAAARAGLLEPLTRGSVVASDAFFPFADGLIATAEAGATAIIQPGGSIRDKEVIAAADDRGLAMAFTGLRRFRH